MAHMSEYSMRTIFHDKNKNIVRVRNFEFTDEKYNIIGLICTIGNYAQERITNNVIRYQFKFIASKTT
jgi:hypothetical protein